MYRIRPDRSGNGNHSLLGIRACAIGPYNYKSASVILPAYHLTNPFPVLTCPCLLISASMTLTLRTFLLWAGLLLAALAQAQTYRYMPAGTFSDAASLFGGNLFRHNQTLYLPSDLNAPAGQVSIGAIYYMQGGNQTVTTIDSLTLKLGQTTATRHTVINFIRYEYFTNLSTVYSDSQRIFTPNTGVWERITLYAPFAYTTANTLVFDVTYKNSSNFAFLYRGKGDFTRVMRAYSPNLTDTAGSASNIIPYFGFDILTSIPGRAALERLTFYPNPAAGAATVRVRHNQTQPQSARLTDVTGRTVWQGRTEPSKELQIATETLPKGAYTLVIGNGLAVGRLAL